MNAPLRNIPLSGRLMILLGLFLFNYILFVSVALMPISTIFGSDVVEAVVSGVIENDTHRNIFLFMQAIGALGAFGFTALLFSQLESGTVWLHLGLTRMPKVKWIALAVFAMFAAQFFIDFLVRINKSIPLPPSLAFLQDTEKKEAQLMNALLGFTSITQFLVTTLVIAVIPALVEEIFFRGLLLGDFLKARITPVWAITLSGLLFALAHFQFNNMLAIWALGAFLGYLYYASGSLWVPVVAHFINNFMAVLFKYLYNRGVISSDMTETEYPWYLIAGSILIFGVCIFVFYTWQKKNREMLVMDDMQSIQETD